MECVDRLGGGGTRLSLHLPSIFTTTLSGANQHLIAHDQLELLEAQSPLRVTELPIVRDAEKVLVCDVQLRLERLRARQAMRVSDRTLSVETYPLNVTPKC